MLYVIGILEAPFTKLPSKKGSRMMGIALGTPNERRNGSDWCGGRSCKAPGFWQAVAVIRHMLRILSAAKSHGRQQS